jgi:hypothetical protein
MNYNPIRMPEYVASLCRSFMLILLLQCFFIVPELTAQEGFGIKDIELGIGISPLGLSNEADFDSFVEFGGGVTFITRNPDNFMLRLSASHGISKSRPPLDFISEGDAAITRFDFFLLYGKYFYGGVGVGYYMFNHELSEDVDLAFQNVGMSAEESIGNSLAYSLKVGVKSDTKIGYFVEATVSLVSPELEATVTDLKTGNSNTRMEPYDLRIIQFFNLGLYYRF